MKKEHKGSKGILQTTAWHKTQQNTLGVTQKQNKMINTALNRTNIAVHTEGRPKTTKEVRHNIKQIQMQQQHRLTTKLR